MGRSREPTRILQAGVQNKRSPLPCPAGHRGAETHRAKAGVVLCPTVGGDDLADLFNVHLVVGIALERTLVKVGELCGLFVVGRCGRRWQSRPAQDGSALH